MLQTSDPEAYVRLLGCSRSINEYYALKNGIQYQSYIGIRRGYFPWHACFNRVFMIHDLMKCGYDGWVFYLDADAYIADVEFDIRTYLVEHNNLAIIMAPGGLTGENWDVNDGVFLLNLGHDRAREIVCLWHASLFHTTDDELRDAAQWEDVPNDQGRLQDLLRQRPDLADVIYIEDRKFFNDYQSSFVRQIFRSEDLTLDDRIAMISAERDRLFGQVTVSMGKVISGLYKEILGRLPDQDGLNHYMDMVKSDILSEKSILFVVQSLIRSDEFLNGKVSNMVHGLYNEILGRDPDEEGFSYFSGIMKSIVPFEHAILYVVRSLINNDEFYRNFQSRLTDEAGSRE